MCLGQWLTTRREKKSYRTFTKYGLEMDVLNLVYVCALLEVK